MKSSMGLGVQSPDRAPLFEVLACIPARPGDLATRLAGLNADALVEAAGRHGASVFLADALASQGLELPAQAHARLQAAARGQIANALKLKRLLLAVVDEFAKHAIRPILLKGYGLATRLFPEQPLARPSSDVDVLIHPDELPAARKAMAALKLVEHHDASLAAPFEEHHHFSFAGPRGLVEVHFRLFSGFGARTFNDAALRSRLVEATLEGRPVRYLGAEDEFVYLATHAANHSFMRITWLVDLQRYLQAREFDWVTMAERTRDAGFSVAVSAALWLVQTALETPIPEAAVRAFPVSNLRRQVHRQVFSKAHVEAADLAAHRVWGFVLRVWLVDSTRNGARHALDGARRLFRQWRGRG